MTTLTLRPGRPSDLAGVAGVFLACWQTSYAGFLTAGQLGRFDADAAAELWRKHLEPVNPGLTVADHEGRVVGMSLVTTPDPVPEPAYLASLYVDPATQGLGVGVALFDAALAAARAGSRSGLRWWVFAANEPSIRFYTRRGGRRTGSERTGDYGAPEIEMAAG